MIIKKLVLFGGAAVVVAGSLGYLLGIYPPVSSRDGQGAIGKRDVYRAEQPEDASVTPGAAPVAMQATLDKLKNHQIPAMQNGQMFTLNNGFAYLFFNGKVVALTAAQANSLASGKIVAIQNQAMAMQNGLVVKTGQVAALSTNAAAGFHNNVQSGIANNAAAALNSGMTFTLANGLTVLVQNGIMYGVTNGNIVALTQNQMTNLNSLNANLNSNMSAQFANIR